MAIIFSDGYNIGSQMSRSEIVKRAMNSNITLYGLGFSPVKGLWKRPAKDPAPDLVAESVARSMPPNRPPRPPIRMNTWDTADIPIMSILLGLGEEAKKPLFKSSLQYFARYSGGNVLPEVGEGYGAGGAEPHRHGDPQPVRTGLCSQQRRFRWGSTKSKCKCGAREQKSEPAPGGSIKVNRRAA